MAKSLIDGPYKKGALVPASPWLDKEPPAAPMVTNERLSDSTINVRWTHANDSDVFHWVVYYQHGTTWTYKIAYRNDRTMVVPASMMINKKSEALKSIAVTAVDRTGNESTKQTIQINN